MFEMHRVAQPHTARVVGIAPDEWRQIHFTLIITDAIKISPTTRCNVCLSVCALLPALLLAHGGAAVISGGPVRGAGLAAGATGTRGGGGHVRGAAWPQARAAPGDKWR